MSLEKPVPTQTSWRELFDAWFHPQPPLPNPERMKRWFVADPAFDATLRCFEPWLDGDLPREWHRHPESALTLVLLYDQIPRNLYRGTAKAFAWDSTGLQVTKAAIARGDDRRVDPIARGFFYLPFEHHESLASQDEAVRLFQALLQEFPASDRKLGEIYLDFAEKHRDVVRRFGRFPHRNRALGRESTPAELEYLAQPGAGF